MTLSDHSKLSTVALRADKTRASTLDMTIAGVRVRIGGLDEAPRVRVHDLLLPFVSDYALGTPQVRIRVAPHQQVRGWRVTCSGHEVMSTPDADHLLTYLDWFAVAQALEASTRVAVFHGAALVRDGAAVLLLAASGAGKTTLTLGLMERGWEPLADDIVLVDRETLAISPFPRCFHVDDTTQALLADPARLEWPAQLTGYARPRCWAEGACPAQTIVVIERCTTCPSMRWPILQAQAAGALITASIRNALPKSEVVDIAARLAANATTCIRLRNGQLDGALNLIESAAAQ